LIFFRSVSLSVFSIFCTHATQSNFKNKQLLPFENSPSNVITLVNC
jgi:hypothetical protein